jgi:fused signal recognition particle receptor
MQLKKEIEQIEKEEKIIETKIEKKEIKIELPKEEIIEEKKPEPKVSIFTKLKSVFAEKYFLSDSEVSELIDQFEMSMLQSDVSLQVCDILTKSLKDKIKKEGISKSHQEEYLKKLFLDIVFENYPKSLDENFFKQSKKPFVILFVGTNGGGKTTNIAKLTYYLKSKGKSVVLAASDTYRAAAIDQLEGHANALNVPIIKGKYGQDPASVAYDAVAFAKTKNIDFVLVDSSGRQDNSQNLMKELEKIKKVISPDFTVFVAEAIAGQTALAQAESFNKYINFDSFVLTKADVDEKGGTLLSISLGLKKPVLFLGVGQEYKDIAFFDKEFLEQVI